MAKPVTIKVNAIHALSAAFEKRDSFFAEKLAAFASGLTVETAGTLFTVDFDLAAMAAAKGSANREAKAFGRPHLTFQNGRTLEAIRDAGGQSLLLASYGGSHSGLTLVGAGTPLPGDLAPAIILDASGRVRGTYNMLGKAKGNLFRLPSPQGDYRNLELHVWRTACGKDALRDDDVNRPLFRGIADAIMTKPDEDWLILGEKVSNDGFSVLALIQDSLPKNFIGKLQYVHWGAHMATNAYAHIRNVVVVGTFHYGSAGYDALAAAATGAEPVKSNGSPLVVSEAQHNLLQGVLRSNARSSIDGVCGESTVYLIVPPFITTDALRETFPVARLTDWRERINPLSAEAMRLVDYLKDNLAVGASIAKGNACDAIGINRKSLSKMIEKAALQNALARINVDIAHKTFVRSANKVEC